MPFLSRIPLPTPCILAKLCAFPRSSMLERECGGCPGGLVSVDPRSHTTQKNVSTFFLSGSHNLPARRHVRVGPPYGGNPLVSAMQSDDVSSVRDFLHGAPGRQSRD